MVREKYRYIVLKISTPSNRPLLNLSAKPLLHAIERAAAANLNDWDYAYTIPRLQVTEFWPYLGLCIIKVLLVGKNTLYRLVPYISTINDQSCQITPLKCSGAIRKSKQWILQNKFS
ncbi:ribonuclease P/MRP protein subunit POP5 [Nematocida homosporus]|uniref:ribonuclease P/MRP protein subunit POP5 n=1 Tax=Nematocida homosporus TaxID=1912981 RepID=UPI00221ECB56|nr:ribonuclease P/MRP protein subunit POP5 [Nematocida homosporus]KAI5185132.1 ribonuclease P/MRP protein subunit POP5 [Nematocida homosporus]